MEPALPGHTHRPLGGDAAGGAGGSIPESGVIRLLRSLPRLPQRVDALFGQQRDQFHEHFSGHQRVAQRGVAAGLDVLEQRRRADALAEAACGALEGLLARVDTALAAMSRGLGDKPFCSGVHFSLSDVAVGCALGYLDFRFPQIDWRTPHPNLTKLSDKLALRQSFVDTVPV